MFCPDRDAYHIEGGLFGPAEKIILYRGRQQVASETDVSVEMPYFDWATNEAAIRESILGTTMGTDPADLVQEKGADGKNYWKTVDGVTGATLATYGLFYGTAKGIYEGIMAGK